MNKKNIFSLSKILVEEFDEDSARETDAQILADVAWDTYVENTDKARNLSEVYISALWNTELEMPSKKLAASFVTFLSLLCNCRTIRFKS